VNPELANTLSAAGIFAVAIAVVWWQATQPARERRRGIRRLEHYANHPGARRHHDDMRNQPREEEEL